MSPVPSRPRSVFPHHHPSHPSLILIQPGRPILLIADLRLPVDDDHFSLPSCFAAIWRIISDSTAVVHKVGERERRVTNEREVVLVE
jgi:hypothetical protein